MIQQTPASGPAGRNHSPDARLLSVDPQLPTVREFVLRHLLKGNIRVFPGDRGSLVLLPTRACPCVGPTPRPSEA